MNNKIVAKAEQKEHLLVIMAEQEEQPTDTNAAQEDITNGNRYNAESRRTN